METNQVTYQNVPALAGLKQYAAAWESRNRLEFSNHPLLDLRFIIPLLTHFGSGKERLLLSKDGNALQTAALLKPKNAFVWESFLPSQAQISPSLIKQEREIPIIWRALPSIPLALDLLNMDPAFAHIDEKSAGNPILQPKATTINVQLDGTFEAYWASRSKNLRKNIRRYTRRLEQDHEQIEFLVFHESAQMTAAVRRYSELELSGWKGKEGTAISKENGQLPFYTEVLSEFAKSENAQVCEIRIKGITIASRLLISGGDQIVILKTAYDENYARYAPGRVLLYKVLEHLFQTKPDKKVEFYTNATDDQKVWATGERTIYHATTFRHPPAQHLIFGAKATLSFLRKIKRKKNIQSEKHSPPRKQIIHCGSFASYKTIPAENWQSENSSFFQGIDWFELLSNTILDSHQVLRIYQQSLSGEGEPKPGLILPFYEEKSGLNKKLTALSNYYTSLYGPVYTRIAEPGLAIAQIINEITTESPAWHQVQINPLAKDSETFNALTEGFRSQGWWVQHYFSHGNWHLPCEGMDYQQYLATRPPRLRNILQRKWRIFGKMENAKLEIFQSTEDLERGIAAFQSVYRKSWKKPEPYPDFIAELIRLCARRGWLRLGVAWIGERPAAAQLWIVCHGIASIYKLAYDESYRKLSVGTILSAHLMSHVLDIDKVREVDYLTGDDPYKQDWMTHRRERWGVIAINPKTPQGLLLIIRHFGGAALRRGMESLSKWMPNRSAKRTP